jgi:FkbM family methyltransferase
MDLLRKIVWALTWPVRTYWARSERKLGKKLVTDRLLRPMLPAPPRGFNVKVPGGGSVHLYYREDLGIISLMGGRHEHAEMERLRSAARPGTVAIDVGANIGLYTVALAGAVGSNGRVLAFEPFPDNVARLRSNLARNDLTNVEIYEVALGPEAGSELLHVADDPAFHSLVDVSEDRDTGNTLTVRVQRLDDAWREAGAPEVSVLKVDTEGGELAILRSATDVLAASRPVIQVEASTLERLQELEEWLRGRGYRRADAPGYSVGNYLFEAA